MKVEWNDNAENGQMTDLTGLTNEGGDKAISNSGKSLSPDKNESLRNKITPSLSMKSTVVV